jgi:16S rRNA (guanine(966)-N(2))-methyltransferase RsmD
LYAGTGAVGIEAISRGARAAIFAEKHRAAVAVIHHNLESLGIAKEAEVIAAEVLPALKRIEARSACADFIFLDPPYNAEEQYERVLEFVGSSHLLAANGKLIAEHSRKLKLPGRSGTLELFRMLEQGDSALSFYRHAVLS